MKEKAERIRKATETQGLSVELPTQYWLEKACEKGSGVAFNTMDERCVTLSMCSVVFLEIRSTQKNDARRSCTRALIYCTAKALIVRKKPQALY